MKTYYIARAYVPSETANSVHVMKISEAFSNLCDDFELIVLDFFEAPKNEKDTFTYYGIKKEFPIKRMKQKRMKLSLNRYLFSLRAMREVKKTSGAQIVTRDPLIAFLAVLRRIHVVLDLHGDLAHLCGRAYRIIKIRKFVHSPCLHLVAISKGLKDFYEKKYPLTRDRFTILPDGFSQSSFEKVSFEEPFRNEEISIGYCGGFMLGKGIGLIAEMASKDPSHDYHLYGGDTEKAEKIIGKAVPKNMLCHGFLPNAEVPEKLNKFDILLLPNQEEMPCMGEDIGKVTSPLKMFEYMATGKVLVGSDLSVLKEILTDENSFLVPSNDADAWIKVIDYIENHKEEAVKKGKQAKEDVMKYSWEARAEKMIKMMG